MTVVTWLASWIALAVTAVAVEVPLAQASIAVPVPFDASPGVPTGAYPPGGI
jgi:hypothetical protein